MNYKTLFVTAFLLASVTTAQAETQVLNLQTASAKTTACGDFALESVNLNATPSANSAAGALSVTNEAGQQVAARKFEAGQAGSLVAKVQPLGSDSVEDLSLQIVTRDEEGKLSVVETVDTNAAGEATFTTALPAGDYQIAVSCGAAAVAAAVTSSTAGIAALGATGVTALAVGASSNGGSGSRVGAEQAGSNPRTSDDVPDAFSLQSASGS